MTVCVGSQNPLHACVHLLFVHFPVCRDTSKMGSTGSGSSAAAGMAVLSAAAKAARKQGAGGGGGSKPDAGE